MTDRKFPQGYSPRGCVQIASWVTIFSGVRTLKIYLLNKFQLFNKVLSIVKQKNKTKNPASWGLHLLFLLCFWGFPGGSSGEEPTWQCRKYKRCGFDPWLGRSLEKGMATHSSILAWRIPWTEDLVGYGPLSCRDGHDRSNLACMHALYIWV